MTTLMTYAKYMEKIIIMFGNRNKEEYEGVNSPFNELPGLQPNKEDIDNIECGEFVLTNINSGTVVNRVKVGTGMDMREQWTLEKVDELHDTVNLAKMGPRRN